MNTKLRLIVAALIGLAASFAARAQPVTIDEAQAVVENWLPLIIEEYGSWGGSPTAAVSSIEDFTRAGKVLGYYCTVEPRGFVLVSSRRELAPIKAYSEREGLVPDSEEGLTGLLKDRMERLLARVESMEAAGRTRAGGAVGPLEIDYPEIWDRLERDPAGLLWDAPPLEATESNEPPASQEETVEEAGEADEANYQEGQVMLDSNWHQFPPYNNFCPYLACTNTSNGRAVVGCVATAGAQIMRYWAWPPYGENGSLYTDSYDWPNMAAAATTGSPAAEQNAVAELSYEVGIAVDMDYGCTGSSAYTSDMEGVFQDHYRYDNVVKQDRDDYTAVAWFDLMKYEFNYNRPVQYRITGHSIVGDGWREYGTPTIREYHMNYGWTGTGSDAWYALDSLTTDPEGEEFLLEVIRPEPVLFDMSTLYARNATFPYRYVYRDTAGVNGSFEGGQRIQFLPGVVAYCSSGTVTFNGSSSNYSYLFTKGDLSRGIKMHLNSAAKLKLYAGGGVKFY
jgi:hypothetical protein